MFAAEAEIMYGERCARLNGYLHDIRQIRHSHALDRLGPGARRLHPAGRPEYKSQRNQNPDATRSGQLSCSHSAETRGISMPVPHAELHCYLLIAKSTSCSRT